MEQSMTVSLRIALELLERSSIELTFVVLQSTASQLGRHFRPGGLTLNTYFIHSFMSCSRVCGGTVIALGLLITSTLLSVNVRSSKIWLSPIATLVIYCLGWWPVFVGGVFDRTEATDCLPSRFEPNSITDAWFACYHVSNS